MVSSRVIDALPYIIQIQNYYYYYYDLGRNQTAEVFVLYFCFTTHWVFCT